MHCSNEERTPCVYSTTGIILNVGFCADKTCENEAIKVKADVLAGNGSPLLMAKFGVG